MLDLELAAIWTFFTLPWKFFVLQRETGKERSLDEGRRSEPEGRKERFVFVYVCFITQVAGISTDNVIRGRGVCTFDSTLLDPYIHANDGIVALYT